MSYDADVLLLESSSRRSEQQRWLSDAGLLVCCVTVLVCTADGDLFILAVDCYLIMSLDVVRVFPCVFWLLILFSVSLSCVLLFSPMYNTYSICIFFLA